MRHLLLAAIVLAACDQPDNTPHDVGKLVVEMCGEPVNAPGWVASFNGDTTTLSTTDYVAIMKFREDITSWRDCVVSIP